MNTEKVKNIFKEFEKKRILVIGDLMVDEYILGDVNRISPEAPVPILNIKEKFSRLGGAGNVISNIIELGGKVFPCGVIGDDEAGLFIQLQIDKNCDLDYILVDKTRPTTKKTRIFSGNQQMFRFDHETTKQISEAEQTLILNTIKNFEYYYSSVIISDYQKGLLGYSLVQDVISFCREHNKTVFVDPKSDYKKYYRANFMTPNLHELAQMTGMKIENDDDIYKAGDRLYHDLELDGLIVTRGKDGISIVRNDGHKMVTLPTVAKEVFDVSGAGDTVISTFVLSYMSGLSMEESAELANLAAGVVVGKMGTAATNMEEILRII